MVQTVELPNIYNHNVFLNTNSYLMLLRGEKGFRSFTEVKVVISQRKNTVLQVKVQKYSHQNVLKVPKALMQNG